MIILFLIFLSPVIVNVASGQITVDYSCKLEWKPDGHGGVPDFSVSPSPTEYIVRVSIENKTANTKEWRIGRLPVETGKANIPLLYIGDEEGEPHIVFTSDTYDVLTNPENCLLEWEATLGGEISPYAIPSSDEDPGPSTSFVGRGMVAGYSLGGAIYTSESGLFVPLEGKVYTRRHYDVLTSRYPPLSMALYDFEFPSLDFRVMNLKSRDIILGQMELVNRNSEAVQVFPITHRKMVKEHFIFEESEGLSWNGVQNISFDMDLWFGDTGVEAEFIDIEGGRLVFSRERELGIDRTITLSNPGHFQACSAYSRLENFVIKFDANAIVTALHLKGRQIKEMLIRTERTILNVRSDDVIAHIHGTLKGSFATGVKALYSDVDEYAPCSSIIDLKERK